MRCKWCKAIARKTEINHSLVDIPCAVLHGGQSGKIPVRGAIGDAPPAFAVFDNPDHFYRIIILWILLFKDDIISVFTDKEFAIESCLCGELLCSNGCYIGKKATAILKSIILYPSISFHIILNLLSIVKGAVSVSS